MATIALQTGKETSSSLIGHGLTKVYHTGEVEIHALRGVDFELRPRELVVLLGPSGSGKSTLLRLLNRLEEPGGGTILLDGQDICAYEVTELRTILFPTAAGPVAIDPARLTTAGGVFSRGQSLATKRVELNV